jgi:hypothetical protein
MCRYLYTSHILNAHQHFWTNRFRSLFLKRVHLRSVHKTVDRIHDMCVCVCVCAHHCKHYMLSHLKMCVYKIGARKTQSGQLSRYSDWLRAGRSGDWIPVGARFSAPVQTGPGARPASCTMDYGSFPGGRKRPGRGADPSPPSSAEV